MFTSSRNKYLMSQKFYVICLCLEFRTEMRYPQIHSAHYKIYSNVIVSKLNVFILINGNLQDITSLLFLLLLGQ